jgi:hypothetical protein
MRRTTGALILLAAVSGCMSTRQEPEVTRKIVYDYRQVPPKATDSSQAGGTQSPATGTAEKPPAFANGTATPATPATRTVVTEVAATTAAPTALATPATPAAPTPPAASKSPSTVPNSDSNAPTMLTRSNTPERPPEHALAMNDAAMLPDAASLKSKVAASIARSEARSGETPASTANETPSSLPDRPKPAAAPGITPVTTNKPADPIVASGYLPSVMPASLEVRPAVTAVRMVNSKRVTLNYRVNDVGPSGVSAVDVWYTQDSRIWKKFDGTGHTRPPCIVEVNDEGLYGFTLLARNGLGVGKPPPQPGDMPQVWVEVDVTKPVVHMLGVETGVSGRSTNVLIRWSAADKNLAPRPITLSYADNPKGPWMPIAANLENTERYVWQLPANPPPRFYIRVEANDQAGNIGMAQSGEPVSLDLAQPTVSILTVEPGR